MWLTHLLGRRLVPINYDRFRHEADFRYGLVRFRDHVERGRLSAGEPGRAARSGPDRFAPRVVDVFLQLIRAEVQLSVLYRDARPAERSCVPLIVAAPSLLPRVSYARAGSVQTRVAYDQVSGALCVGS